MHKGSDLIGKTVVSYDTGEYKGRVKQLLVDPGHNRFLGFLIESDSTPPEQVLRCEHIQAVGPDAVVIGPSRDLGSPVVGMSDAFGHQEDFVAKGLKIMTEDGRDLGTLVDVYVNTKNGQIVGYAVRHGLFSAFSGGQTFVPTAVGAKVGKEILFVPATTADRMNEQPCSQESTARDGGQQAEPGAEKFLKAARHPRGEARTLGEVEGRRAQRAVYTEQQEMLVAQGQVITAHIVEQAREHQLEQALIESTHGASWGTQKILDDEMWQNARVRLEEEAKQLSSGVGKMWQKVKEGASDLGKFAAKKTPPADEEK
ncbi:MAG: PRC-barrel domain-containing protein [Candidatus Binatia bacterium]